MPLEQPNDSTFAPAPIEGSEQVENFKEHFVGEGKKYATDEDAMKGLFFANQHIDKIEKENEEAQGELKLRASVESILASRGQTLTELSQEITPEDPAPDLGENTTPTQTATPSEKDLSELIRNVVSEDQLEARRTANYEEAVHKLDAIHGSRESANSSVVAKAEELGIGVEMFMETAKQSPEAFYSLMGLTSKTKTNTSGAASSDVNTASFTNSNISNQNKVGTYAYYEEMRRSDPRKYNSSHVQTQLHKDAMSDSDKFFGRN